MYTLWRPSALAAYIARSRNSRASSTPRFDAASSSTTSRLAAPVQMRVHESRAPLAIERHGEDSRGGRLTHTPGTREQIAVRRAAMRHRATQRRRHVVLHDEVGELLGTVLAGEGDHDRKSGWSNRRRAQCT